MFDQKDWASAYCNVEEEVTNTEMKLISGVIPKGIRGTLYKNGPGQLEREGTWVHHPFDGDGMISAIHFSQGKASISNRFVRTEGWIEEERKGKFVFRGVFGTQKPGGLLRNIFDLRLKNIANTHVVKLGDELLALWEAASPYSLDPITLETKGISNVYGALSPGEAFSAHPHFDPGHHKKKRMVTFGVKTGPKSTIRLMEFETEGTKAGALISSRQDSFNGFCFLHDFAITPNWAIFLQNAMQFNPLPFILGKKGAAQCLSSKRNGTAKFLLIPRDCGKFSGKPPRTIDAPEGFVFHHLNAYEQGETINIESIFYKDFPSIEPDQDFRQINFDELPEGILKRCCINLKENLVQTKILSNQCCEFAMVNPKKQGLHAKYAWMATAAKLEGNGPLQGIKKLDLATGEAHVWSAGPQGFLTEPIMVPDNQGQEEDSGWILALTWNGRESASELVILNAKNLTEEAILKLPINIPYGLHGSWVDSISIKS